MGVIKDELIEIKEKYGDDRRTKIVSAVNEMDDEDLIEEKQVAITLTHLGYLKRYLPTPTRLRREEARESQALRQEKTIS